MCYPTIFSPPQAHPFNGLGVRVERGALFGEIGDPVVEYVPLKRAFSGEKCTSHARGENIQNIKSFDVVRCVMATSDQGVMESSTVIGATRSRQNPGSQKLGLTWLGQTLLAVARLSAGVVFHDEISLDYQGIFLFNGVKLFFLDRSTSR